MTRAVAVLSALMGLWLHTARRPRDGSVARTRAARDDHARYLGHPVHTSRWGSLASFAARAAAGTRKIYGTSGNSFIAAVEFGPRVRAKAVMVGGQSGNPDSPHFRD